MMPPAQDVLQDWNGALADERDRHWMGGDAVARDEDRRGRRLLAPSARVLEAGAAHALACRAQASDQLVERALAATITGEPDAPQDSGAGECRLLSEPLDDRWRVARDGRRAPGASMSRRRLALFHERISGQVRYRNGVSTRSGTSGTPVTNGADQCRTRGARLSTARGFR